MNLIYCISPQGQTVVEQLQPLLEQPRAHLQTTTRGEEGGTGGARAREKGERASGQARHDDRTPTNLHVHLLLEGDPLSPLWTPVRDAESLLTVAKRVICAWIWHFAIKKISHHTQGTWYIFPHGPQAFMDSFKKTARHIKSSSPGGQSL